MAPTNTRPINEQKLRREIEKRGLTLVQVSQDMGRGKSYMNHVMSDLKISEPTVVQLKLLYNLPYEAYEPDKEPEPEPEPEKLDGQMEFKLPPMIGKKELWEIIYTATKKALEDAERKGNGTVN